MSTPHQDTGPVTKNMTLTNPRTGEDIEAEVPVYTRQDPHGIGTYEYAHPEHLKIAAINADVKANGTHWTKCANCGEPYVVTAETGETVCSDTCAAEFRASLGF